VSFSGFGPRRKGKRKLLPQKRAGGKALDAELGMAGTGALALEELPMNVLATPVAWRTRRTAGAKM
jgi:hypothetical protein